MSCIVQILAIDAACECIYTYQGHIDGGLSLFFSQWRGPQNIFGVINLNSIILQTMSTSKATSKSRTICSMYQKQSQNVRGKVSRGLQWPTYLNRQCFYQ